MLLVALVFKRCLISLTFPRPEYTVPMDHVTYDLAYRSSLKTVKLGHFEIKSDASYILQAGSITCHTRDLNSVQCNVSY